MEAASQALARLDHPAHHPPLTDDEYEHQALELQDRIASMSDQELVAAYNATDGTPGDPYVEALIAAMRERDVDF